MTLLGAPLRGVALADRLPGLSEDTTEHCQRVRHDGVGTVIGEEMCRAVDDVASEIVSLAAVDV
jgi:hypothetical protein